MLFETEFFQEENREGFVVPEMMKRAWAAAYEVLEVIDGVCNKIGTRYFVCAGTLLGAVRHKGFIPWDDDIDICMLRDDYLKFLEMAPDYLPEGFVISGMFSDDVRLQKANKEPQARVIADETFFPLPKYMNRFHAYPYMRIGVDIFPLYNLPNDINKQIELVGLINDMQVTAEYLNHYRKTGELSGRIKKYEDIAGKRFDASNDDVLAKNIRLAADKLASDVDSSDADLICCTPYRKLPEDLSDFKGFAGFKPEWFKEQVKLKFETTEVIAPVNYTEVLRAQFGDDYMTPQKFTGDHNYPIYKNQEEAFSKLLLESGVTTPVDEFCRNWHMMTGGR